MKYIKYTGEIQGKRPALYLIVMENQSVLMFYHQVIDLRLTSNTHLNSIFDFTNTNSIKSAVNLCFTEMLLIQISSDFGFELISNSTQMIRQLTQLTVSNIIKGELRSVEKTLSLS